MPSFEEIKVSPTRLRSIGKSQLFGDMLRTSVAEPVWSTEEEGATATWEAIFADRTPTYIRDFGYDTLGNVDVIGSTVRNRWTRRLASEPVENTSDISDRIDRLTAVVEHLSQAVEQIRYPVAHLDDSNDQLLNGLGDIDLSIQDEQSLISLFELVASGNAAPPSGWTSAAAERLESSAPAMRAAAARLIARFDRPAALELLPVAIDHETNRFLKSVLQAALDDAAQ